MSFANVLSSPKVRRTVALLKREAVGLAQDFWKDGHWEKLDDDEDDAPVAHSNIFKPKPKETGVWHAEPGEVSERMWGNGYVTPADEYITDLLIRPLGVTKDMSMLDISAGLGGRMRRTAAEFGIYINGREPDPEIAARGMALSVAAGKAKKASITPYDPMSFTEPRTYDSIVGRETIYRVQDKQVFVKALVSCCKPKAQISFTDYILNPEDAQKPAILAWKAYEKGANPPGLIEMAEVWARAGISLRVHDDQTEYYKKEVKLGLVRLAKFMATGVKPDAQTRRSIEKRITTWAHRMAAMEQGLRFFRFYGQR